MVSWVNFEALRSETLLQCFRVPVRCSAARRRSTVVSMRRSSSSRVIWMVTVCMVGFLFSSDFGGVLYQIACGK